MDFGLTPYFKWALSLFSGAEIATTIALGMLFFAFVSYGWIRFRDHVFQSSVGSLVVSIRSAKNVGEARRAIASQASPFPVLKSRFSQYLDEVEGETVLLADPKVFTDRGSVGGTGYLAYYSFWASTWLMIGLVFTFVGLSGALLHAGGGESTVVGAAQMQEAVSQILSVSSAKFITSIFGIVLFIIGTVLSRRRTDAADKAIANLASAIREKIRCYPPEKMLKKQMTAGIDQADALKAFGSTLAQALGSAIVRETSRRDVQTAAAVAARVVEGMQPLGNELMKAAEDLRAERGEAASNTMDRFLDAWNEGVGDRLEAFGSKVDGLVTFLDRLPQSVLDRSSEAELRLEEASRRLTESVESIGTALETNASRLDSSVASLAEQMAHLSTRSVAVAQETQEALSRSVEASVDAVLRKASEAADEGHARMIFDFERSRERMEAHLESMAKGISNGVIGHQRDATQQTSEMLSSLSSAMKESVEISIRSLREQQDVSREETADALRQSTSTLRDLEGSLRSIMEGSVQAQASASTSQVEAIVAASREMLSEQRNLSERISRERAEFSALEQQAATEARELSLAALMKEASEISAAISSAKDGMVSAITSANSTLAATSAGLRALVEDSFAPAVTDAGREFLGAVSSGSKSFVEAAELAGDRMDSSSSKVGESLVRASEAIDLVSSDLKQGSHSLVSASNAVEETARNALERSRNMERLHVIQEDLADRLLGASGSFAETAGAIREAASSSSEVATVLSREISNGLETLEARSASLHSLQDKTIRIVQDLEGRSVNLGSELSKGLNVFDDHLAKAIGQFSHVLGEMEEVLEGFHPAIPARTPLPERVLFPAE